MCWFLWTWDEGKLFGAAVRYIASILQRDTACFVFYKAKKLQWRVFCLFLPAGKKVVSLVSKNFHKSFNKISQIFYIDIIFCTTIKKQFTTSRKFIVCIPKTHIQGYPWQQTKLINVMWAFILMVFLPPPSNFLWFPLFIHLFLFLH